MTAKTKGIVCLVASAFGFAVMGFCVRFTDSCGDYVPAFQKSFFRNVVAVSVAAALCLRHGVRPPPAGTMPLLVLRSTLGTIGIFANFYALSHMPLGDAMTLNKLAPFFTVFFSWMFLKERLTMRQALCIAGAFAGAVLVMKPTGTNIPAMPAIAGFVGGASAGGAYACVRALGLRKTDARVIVLFFSVFSCLASAPFLIFDYHPMTFTQVLVLIGAGTGATLGQFGITAAYRFAPPREIAVWDYTNILFAAVFGFLAFDQIPDASSLCGFALILAMAMLLHRRHHDVMPEAAH